MSAIPNIPTVTDELNRKTIETMLWLTEQRDSGQITANEFYLGAEVAFMIVSGLADKDISSLTWVDPPEDYKRRSEYAILRKKDDLLLLRRILGSTQVRPILIRNGRLATLKASEGVTSLSSVLKKLQIKGWSPITEENLNA